ncbi:MAG: CysZ protein [Saprospiraceae bacterium]
MQSHLKIQKQNMKGFFKGIGAYRRVFSLIRKYHLWSYLLIPGLIGMLIGGGILAGAWTASDDLGSMIISWYPENWWGSAGLGQVGDVLGGLLVAVLGLLLFKYILLIAVSPFMSLLSEKIESKITGQPSPAFNFSTFLNQAGRALRLNLRNIFREVLLTLVLWVLSLSGILAPVTTPLLFAISAYYAGFGILDYTMERHFNYKNSIYFVHDNRGLTLGIGTVFMLILFIPFVGFFFAPTFATIASVKPVLDRMDA